MNVVDFVKASRFYLPLRLVINRWRGYNEVDLKLAKLLTRAGNTVIDIGAHKGLYSIPLAQIGCIVHAFEASRECVALLQNWALLKETVTIYNFALSNRSGTSILNIPVGVDGVKHIASASVSKAFDQDYVEQEIVLKCLDEFQFNSIDFIKIDVEGHEDEVLKGAVSSIERCRPILLIEIEQRHRQEPVSSCIKLLTQRGYRAFQYDGRNFKEVFCDNPATWGVFGVNYWFFDQSKVPSVVCDSLVV